MAFIWVFDEYDESCGPGFDFVLDLWTPYGLTLYFLGIEKQLRWRGIVIQLFYCVIILNG